MSNVLLCTLKSAFSALIYFQNAEFYVQELKKIDLDLDLLTKYKHLVMYVIH